LLDRDRSLLIACAIVIEEVLPWLPPTISYRSLDFGLHLRPENLRQTLQEIIDAGPDFRTIILGYGLCSMAVVGLTANRCRLIIPRVDDCIALFLGSQTAYSEQSRHEPGTYYLTKGWIEVSDTLLGEYEQLSSQYGQERARYIMQVMLKHYRRLAYIHTGHSHAERYRVYAQQTAAHFDLRYEEIQGNDALVRKMIYGPWDEDFVIVPEGQTVNYTDFVRSDAALTTIK